VADGVDSLMYEFGAGKSAIRTVFEETCALREQGRTDFWDFSIGNPYVSAPPKVNETIREVLGQYAPIDLHGYPPNNGWPATRAAVAKNLNERFSTNYSMGDVVMTGGCAGAITATICALTTAGEDIIVITPYFPEYRMYIQAWKCKCVEVPSEPETFQLDIDAIRKAITPCTRMVIVNTPNNPTGAVYSEESLRALGDVLREASKRYQKTIYLLSDEPYREICYDGAQNPWVADCYENTIVCYSWSKSLSLPGERVGYALVPPSVTNHSMVYDALLGAQRAVNTITNSLFTRVIERCVDLPAPVGEYERKRKIIYEGLSDIGYEVVRPQGAFYLWLKCLEEDDHSFCRRAAAEQHLFLVESTDFGCSGWARISYACSDETLSTSLPAFRRLFDSYGGYQW
jgi:aspartate aminotransferase